MLKLKTLKKELIKNERAISLAIKENNLSKLFELRNQRDILKNMVIEAQDKLINQLMGVA